MRAVWYPIPINYRTKTDGNMDGGTVCSNWYRRFIRGVCVAVLVVLNVDAINDLAIFWLWFVAAKFILACSCLFGFI